MSSVPLQYQRPALLPGATEQWVCPRWLRLTGWVLAADATFAAAVLGTVAIRSLF